MKTQAKTKKIPTVAKSKESKKEKWQYRAQLRGAYNIIVQALALRSPHGFYFSILSATETIGELTLVQYK